MSKLIDLIGLTNIANDIKSWVNAHFLRKEEVPAGSTPSTTTPKMDGVASVGTENAFARGDHRHPSDTSKVDVVDGKGLSTNDFTNDLKQKLDGLPTAAQLETVTSALNNRVTTIEGKEEGWDRKQDAINDLDTIRSGAEAGASAIPMPSGGSVGQVLKKTADGTEWANESGGGGGGTSDYSNLTNKPQINSVTLSGNKSLSDLGIAAAADIPTVPTKLSEFTDDLGTSPTHSHSQYLTSHQDITGKADKVSSATNGNFAALDSNGNLTDSGHKHSDYLTSHQDISGKADKVTSATSGNFAGLDSNGNLTDSGHKHSDYLTSHQDISGKEDKTNKVTSFQSTPDDTHYPSEKLVKDSLDAKQATLTFEGTYNASTNKAATMSAVIPSTTEIKNIVYITESDYNNLGTKVATTLYLIPES